MEVRIEYEVEDPSESDKQNAASIVSNVVQQLIPMHKELDEKGVLFDLKYLKGRPALLLVDGPEELQEKIINTVNKPNGLLIWKRYRKFRDLKMATVSDKILSVLYQNLIQSSGDILNELAYSESKMSEIIQETPGYVAKAFMEMRERNSEWFMQDFIPPDVPKPTGDVNSRDIYGERLKAFTAYTEYLSQTVRPFSVLPEYVEEVKKFIDEGGYNQVIKWEKDLLKNLPADKKHLVTDRFILDTKNNLSRIQELINSGIIQDRSSPVYKNSVFGEVLICLKDLLLKAKILGQKIDFTDDVLIDSNPRIKVFDVTELIRHFRDCVCHSETIQRNAAPEIVITYTQIFGKAVLLETPELTIETKYDDDIGFVMGKQVLYYRRHLLRALAEVRKLLYPLSILRGPIS